MSTKLNVIFIFLIISSLISLAYSETCNSSQNLSCWCRELPYPTQCLSHLSHKILGPYVINGKRDFLRLTLKAALTEVLRVRKSVIQISESSTYMSVQGNGAWSDCSNLYDLATHQLINTLDVSNNHTDSDTQTWLSAASTNILICESEIYRTSTIQLTPLLNHDITSLIRNSLTINHQWSERAVDYNIRQHFLNKLARGNEQKSSPPPIFFKAHIVVAKDRSGDYKTINEAVTTLGRWKRENDMKYVIYIKSGVYYENIVIPTNLKNVVMVGDGINKTIITRNRSGPKVDGLIQSATIAVYGSGFFAQGITFTNEAGPNGGQAVAMASLSDQSVFYQCSFLGYQDTLLAGSGRQFYSRCFIRGTVDFIFGNAAAVFQKCTIMTTNRRSAVITAQSREFPYDNTGFSFQYSLILPSNNTFLGRPWRDYSRVGFIQSYFNSQINPVGWLKFTDTSDVSKLCYREYKNFGPGSSTGRRVIWKGYNKAMDYKEAQQYTVSRLIDGLSWLPKTKVSYDPWL